MRLEQTQWLHYIRLLLAAAVKTVVCLTTDGCSVLIHCSDGWDRTCQLTSLCLLMLDPYHRTLNGFAVLIEKEWCSFGHQFATRYGHCSEDADDSQRAPIFLQFLDCVYQIQHQFIHQFEFNEHLLIDLYDQLLACRFGSFLFNSIREREQNQTDKKTFSVWELLKQQQHKYLNPLYSAQSNHSYPNHQSLCIPSCSAKRIVLWEGCHLRWDPDYYQQQQQQLKYQIHNNSQLRKAAIQPQDQSLHPSSTSTTEDTNNSTTDSQPSVQSTAPPLDGPKLQQNNSAGRKQRQPLQSDTFNPPTNNDEIYIE